MAKMFSSKVLGLNKLKKKMDSMQAEMLKGQVGAVAESTLLVHRYAVELLQDNNDGSPQIRYAPRRIVNVSKPFTPPNTDTGRAVQSIKFDFQRSGMTGRVGTNLKYLAWLEFGTENTQPRPWLSVALQKAADEVSAIFAKHIKGGIK